MKEGSSALEVNRVLLRDQASNVKKITTIEGSMSQEKERTERRRVEINQLIKKVRLFLLTSHSYCTFHLLFEINYRIKIT